MKTIKRILRKIAHRNMTPHEAIQKLRDGGARIGERLHVYGNHLNIDRQFPFMLTIGDDVEIAADVTILNHDYSWSVIKKYNGLLLGGVGPVEIGNNVFIGTGALILMNSHIGNNCIVGARSVVSGTFPDNVVIAGIPARIVCTLSDYIKKRSERQLNEAIQIVKHYRKSFKRNPPKNIFPAYFWLFEQRENSIKIPEYLQRMSLKGTYQESMKLFKESEPYFKDFETFLESIPFED